MALFRYQVFYQKGSERPWTNVWHTDAADLVTAAGEAVATLAPGLLPLLAPSCQIVKVLTSTPGTPGSFIDNAIGAFGTASGLGDLLPLFNTVRVLFPILAGGRADYKFFRGFIDEGHQVDGVISGGTLTGVESIINSLVSAMSTAGTPLCDTDLNTYSIVVAQALVQERQRNRRRRRTP